MTALLLLPLIVPAPLPLQADPGPFASWHRSHAEAVEAARESGKPVLLFELFGRLDEELC